MLQTPYDQEDDMIENVMKEKTMNYKFLLAVQERDYELAKEIGNKILNVNPEELSVKRFMMFIGNFQEDLEWLEEEDEEEEEEEEDLEAEDDEEYEIENENEESQEDEEEDDEEEKEYSDEQEDKAEDGILNPIGFASNHLKQRAHTQFEIDYPQRLQQPLQQKFITQENQNVDPFVKDDNNEGDISITMDLKIEELKRQRRSIPQSQQSKPYSSGGSQNVPLTQGGNRFRAKTPKGQQLPKIGTNVQKQSNQRPKSTMNVEKAEKLEPIYKQKPHLQTKPNVNCNHQKYSIKSDKIPQQFSQKEQQIASIQIKQMK